MPALRQVSSKYERGRQAEVVEVLAAGLDDAALDVHGLADRVTELVELAADPGSSARASAATEQVHARRRRSRRFVAQVVREGLLLLLDPSCRCVVSSDSSCALATVFARRR
jgi:hypothetical protein